MHQTKRRKKQYKSVIAGRGAVVLFCSTFFPFFINQEHDSRNCRHALSIIIEDLNLQREFHTPLHNFFKYWIICIAKFDN